MQALTYWKTVTVDKSNLIEQLFALLDEHQIGYCLIGGQAVNATRILEQYPHLRGQVPDEILARLL